MTFPVDDKRGDVVGNRTEIDAAAAAVVLGDEDLLAAYVTGSIPFSEVTQRINLALKGHQAAEHSGDSLVERELVVVDVETTGLDPARHAVLEVAAVNVATGEEFCFAPWIPSAAMAMADPRALQINRYFERGVWADAPATQEADRDNWSKLWKMLSGNTLGGSNPAFDAAMLLAGYATACNVESVRNPWHHRLADLAAYAAPALGLGPTELPGLKSVCDQLGVEIGGEHTALGDARATAECFRRLMADHYREVTK